MQTTTNSLLKTIAKNTGFVMLGNTALKALNFIFSVYIIRRLGDDRFGEYSIVIAFVGLFQILAELGMSQYAMREIARDRSKTQQYFWNLIIIRLILGAWGICIITLAARLMQYTPEEVLGVLIFTCSFLLSAFQAPIQMVLTANERFDGVAWMNILGQTAFVLFGAFFLLNGFGYVWLIVAGLINLLAQIILGGLMIRKLKLVESPGRVSPRIWLHLIRSGIPFGIISVSLTIAFNVDTVLLSKNVPNNEVGWYNVAYGLVFSLMFLSSSFKDAMTPSLAKTFATDPSEIEKWFFRAVKMIVLVSAPIAVGGMIVADSMIRFLYTDTYQPVVPALRLIIWDVPFLMLAGFCGNMSTVIKQERIAARIYLLAAAANIGMNLYAIPRYGYLGASLTTVLTDIISASLFIWFLARQLNLRDMRAIIFRILLAAGLMGIAVYLAGNRNLFLLTGIGIVVYAALLLVLRLFDQTEWSILQRMFHKVFPFIHLNAPGS